MQFGNTTIEGSNTTISKNLLVGMPFAGGPTSGTLQSISIYCTLVNTGATIQLALYGETSGNLIGSTTSLSPSFTAGWITGSTSGTLNDANGNYYICFNQSSSTSNAIDYYYSTTGGGGIYYVSETYGTWPSTIPSLTLLHASYLVSIYFTYTTGVTTPSNYGYDNFLFGLGIG